MGRGVVILWDPCGLCGNVGDVDLYPAGYRCARHAPAAVAGRTIPTPVPLDDQARPPVVRDYGQATDDPLGRTVTRDTSGRVFGDRLPRRSCPRCCDNGDRSPVRGHPGPHNLD